MNLRFAFLALLLLGLGFSQTADSQGLTLGVQQKGTVTSGHCTSWTGAGYIQDAGSGCGGAGGSPGGTAGQIQYNNTGAFGGFTASGDATINTGTGAVTVTATNGSAFGTFATQNFATPPALGGTTPNTAVFSSVTLTGPSVFAVTTDATTARTLSTADCGKSILFTSASAVTVSVPNTITAGCAVALYQSNTASVSVATSGGSTLHSPHSFTKTFAQFSTIGVWTSATGIWNFTGDGA